MGYENLLIREAHHPICPEPSCHHTYLHPAFSWMEDGTRGISPPPSIVPFPHRAQLWGPGSRGAVGQHILPGAVPRALSWGAGEGVQGSGSQLPDPSALAHRLLWLTRWLLTKQHVHINSVQNTFCWKLVFCQGPADGSFPLPVSSPKYISWTGCYAIFICWDLTVNI